MTNVADRMLELLLFPLTDQRWVDLFQELEMHGTPLSKEMFGRVERTGRELVHYTSKMLGVRLYGEADGWFVTIHFWLGPTYTGDLPFGLRPDFSISDVRKLLGPPLNPPHKTAEPYSDKFASQSFYFDPYQVCVWYSLANESLYEIRVMRTADRL